ncbi:3-methyladenine DNA glycosylase AlkD [Massilia sp. PDC64]|nr:DNA alkylation repair protein [Massilia sp. PDC64]SDD99487.1 3-methyladenine DNA glycosylase AlkD [Massilia sp. PDC64]
MTFDDEIAGVLAPLADPARAVAMRAYMLDQFAFLGLPAPVRRAAAKPLVARPWASPHALLEAAGRLWQRPEREYRYTAIDLLARHRRMLSPAHVADLRALLVMDPWWDTVDGLAGVLGEVLFADRTAGQPMMDAWIADASFWVRRAAMLHQLGWRLETDRDRLFGYAAALAAEQEFFIRKAIGWALRDYARWDGAAVRAFVAAHEDVLSSLSRREALKHRA